jgi:hypothetical protein
MSFGVLGVGYIDLGLDAALGALEPLQLFHELADLHWLLQSGRQQRLVAMIQPLLGREVVPQEPLLGGGEGEGFAAQPSRHLIIITILTITKLVPIDEYIKLDFIKHCSHKKLVPIRTST